MNERTARLRQRSLDTPPSLSSERARLLTDFYQEHADKHPAPVLRALSFLHLCRHKTLHIGEDELIVGERGPAPKVVPTFPELTCHSIEDLEILNSRHKTWYRVDYECLRDYAQTVIPYWSGRTMRERMFAELPPEWHDAYGAGVFTEFMEQRAPGHTVLDGRIYQKGLRQFKREIARAIESLDFENDPQALARRDTLRSFDLSCDAVIEFARRHAVLAREMAGAETRPQRRAELLEIADTCERVPADAPRTFREALQAYWFCHLAIITELNGWDSMSPGHLDQHLLPFYQKELAAGTLTRDAARELLECFFIKFNNHPAPPKVGVTAAESGTYTDFANINIGGLLADGSDGSNELSHMLLDIVEDMHLLQPSTNLQLSRKSPDQLLKHTLRVVAKGHGFPSIFNADIVVEEQLRQGKSLEDARAGGCSGCVEVGAFGKEAYVLTGYFNLPKVLEITLHDGRDPRTGKQLGPHTGTAEDFTSYDALFAAFQCQLRHFIDIKIRGSRIIERMYADLMPAPFLSVLIDDCIAKGLDYNAGGARYNNTYIQMVGIGSITDSLCAVAHHVFGRGEGGPPIPLGSLVAAMDADFAGEEALRQRLIRRSPKYGNDDDRADSVMLEVFESCFQAVDGRPAVRGGCFRVMMLPTTCHVYFGGVTGAMPDGRHARQPLSEGISPVQGADRIGPTGVIKSAAKMDHVKTGGTLLNMKFSPTLVATPGGIDQWAGLVRSYFRMDGHHLQFNVHCAATLRQAQARPEEHRGLIVRVAGYSDYFCDLSPELQEEIISRTEHASFTSPEP